MSHPVPPNDPAQESVTTRAANARRGLILFAVYVILYGLFVYLSAFRPDVMAARPMGGANVAVLYGLGLIVVAIVLAVLYMALCRTDADAAADSDREGRP